MIKKRLNKIVLALSLLGTSLLASETKSLIAIDTGFNILNIQKNTTPKYDKNDNLLNLGIKLGSQTKDYRIFLGVHYFYNLSNDFDYAFTYEVEGQYLMNLNPHANIFIGINVGVMNIEFIGEGETTSRTIADSYLGMSAGMNYNISKDMDMDFGVRISTMDSQNIKNNITYKFGTMASLYTSIIYKYSMK